MAALTALPLSLGMRDLEERAEDEDTRQYAADSNHDSTKPSAESGGSQSANGVSSPPPRSHREYTAAFFHPRVFFVFILGCLVPMIYIYLYVGAFWNPQSRIYHAVVLIFNFDAGINRTAVIAANQLNATGEAALSRVLPTDNVGELLGSTLLYTNSTAALFDWRYCDASNCSYSSPDEVQSAVDRGDIDAWYSLCIPADYTQQLLQQAFNLYELSQLNDNIAQLVADNALPDPLNGTYTNYVIEIWDQGRSLPTYSFLSTTLTAALAGLSSAVTRQIYSNIAALPYGTNIVKAAFLFSPVPVLSVDVHPVSHYGMNFFSYLSGLVLWIGSIVTMTVVIKWSSGVERRFFASHSQTPTNLHAGFGISIRVLLVALINIVQAALVLSVLPALGGGGITAYGYGHLFVWLWYSAFCMSLTVGGLVALVGPEVFQLFATLWLILQLTSSGGLIDQVLQPGFYQIGVAFPLYYVVQGNRTILFGSYYHIEKDALVLFGWAVGSLIVIALLATRRIDRQWDRLRDSALVDALRDTTGFSASRPHLGIGTPPTSRGEERQGGQEKDKEKGSGSQPTSSAPPTVEMHKQEEVSFS